MTLTDEPAVRTVSGPIRWPLMEIASAPAIEGVDDRRILVAHSSTPLPGPPRSVSVTVIPGPCTGVVIPCPALGRRLRPSLISTDRWRAATAHQSFKASVAERWDA